MGATVKTIEYDPNRSARIALLVYEDGEKRYIIAPAGLKVGQDSAFGFRVLHLKLVIALPWLKFLWVRWFITLNCIRVKVVQWHEVPVPMHSLPPAMENMRLSSCLRVNRE